MNCEFDAEDSQKSFGDFQLDTMANNTDPDDIYSLQRKLDKMNHIMSQQAQVLGNLAAAAREQPVSPHLQENLNLIEDMKLNLFIQLPVDVFNQVNPIGPILAFDGSNYVEWTKAIDRTLQFAFSRDQSFFDDLHNSFDLLMLQNRAVTSLIVGTIDEELSTVVVTGGWMPAVELFDLLRETCERPERRHKIILAKEIIKLAVEQSPASEDWLNRFHTIMTDIKQAKISVDELGGLLMQSLAIAPPGVDSKNFESSIAQTLDDQTKIPRLDEVATIIRSALNKARTSDHQLTHSSIPPDANKLSVEALESSQDKPAPPQTESSISQPLNDKKEIPTGGEVTTIDQSVPHKADTSDQLTLGSIPSNSKTPVQALESSQVEPAPSEIESSVSQPLGSKMGIPPRGEVTTINQLPSSKAGASDQLTTGSIPFEFKMLGEALISEENKETFPHEQANKSSPDYTQRFAFRKSTLEKALYYKGRDHSTLLEPYGRECRYCGKTGHWYADCEQYWEDTRRDQIEAHGADANSIPPQQPNLKSRHRPIVRKEIRRRNGNTAN
ncbi:uncharacterized protein PGTG_09030 [Puccinia graminis f. sp. tritici CRL 75-36-700-3]|uniref:CCHC-type domain-containing protein n=1 Tax=Puccinia graminis f. sp. tritici (strain CRL 75-36-700-3 / race SCCL) TaxID=418459 RepID=E3KFL3_PUCGT|nr:uncharacterized protein PGTG_09030 [Puccinia graminis f. sp. tritici CRL 75-36-700-3]EFP83077.2 hypothetical protein PGTG_09030 [Puccinia graminis f. sp. tritici CRL 75-36-700-3]